MTFHGKGIDGEPSGLMVSLAAERTQRGDLQRFVQLQIGGAVVFVDENHATAAARAIEAAVLELQARAVSL